MAHEKKRVVQLSVCPGEPTDGTGRLCIHLFVQDERGPITEPHVLHPAAEAGKVEARPTRGRLACDPRRTCAPVVRAGVTVVTLRTDDPRAATCPKCLASEVCRGMMAKLEPSAAPAAQ